MDQNRYLKPEWVNQYLTAEERTTMRDLAKQSYSKEALQKLADRGWTEDNHKDHLSKYHYFRETLTKLVNENDAPDSPEAQQLVSYLMEMNKAYSQGDPQIKDGMKKSWENLNSLPEDQKPKTYTIPDHERAFIKEACTFFYQKKLITRKGGTRYGSV